MRGALLTLLALTALLVGCEPCYREAYTEVLTLDFDDRPRPGERWTVWVLDDEEPVCEVTLAVGTMGWDAGCPASDVRGTIGETYTRIELDDLVPHRLGVILEIDGALAGVWDLEPGLYDDEDDTCGPDWDGVIPLEVTRPIRRAERGRPPGDRGAGVDQSASPAACCSTSTSI